MRRVLYTYLFAYAALSASAVANVAHADSEASVETHISGSSQMSVQIGNTVETNSSSGGSVEMRIETIENGVKKTSEFRKTLAPGESFRYATTVESASPSGSASVHSATFVAATSGVSGRATSTVRSVATPAAKSAAASVSSTDDDPIESRAPSRLLTLVGYIRGMLRQVFAWW